MGLFQQRDEDEQKQWAGLPSEPRGPEDAVDTLATSSVDPFAIDLTQVTSVVFPVAPPPPTAVVRESGEPEGPDDDPEDGDPA